MNRIRITGVAELAQALARAPGVVRGHIGGALFAVAQDVLKVSGEAVPIDTGTLKSSRFTVGPEDTSRGIEVTIGYGGAAAAYALPVHEMPETNRFSRPGTGPKYLERPLNEARRGFLQAVVEYAQSRIERDVR
jgi:hypothetical protein